MSVAGLAARTEWTEVLSRSHAAILEITLHVEQEVCSRCRRVPWAWCASALVTTGRCLPFES